MRLQIKKLKDYAICVTSQLEHAYVMWKKMEMSKPLSQSIYKFSPLKWRDRDANG